MAEARWAKVLQAVYEAEDAGTAGIREATDLDERAIDDGMSFLDRHGLIEDMEEPVLTEKGFEVARQREMQRSQFEMNLFLAAFTFVLSLAIVFQTLFQLRSLGPVGWAIGGLLAVGTVFLFVLLERRTQVIRLLVGGR